MDTRTHMYIPKFTHSYIQKKPTLHTNIPQLDTWLVGWRLGRVVRTFIEAFTYHFTRLVAVAHNAFALIGEYLLLATLTTIIYINLYHMNGKNNYYCKVLSLKEVVVFICLLLDKTNQACPFLCICISLC